MTVMFRCILACMGLIIVISCGEQAVNDEHKETENNAVSNASDASVYVVASVNGETISKADVDFAMQEALGTINADALNDEGQHNFLKSMVASKSMASITLASLSDKESSKLSKKVAAYQEQLLVKMYLKNNIVPEPVSSEMVEKYYLEHPHKFGSEKLIDFSTLKIKDLNEGERAKALKILSTENVRLTDLNQQLEVSGFVSELVSKRVTKNSALKGKDSLVASRLKEGETSKVFFTDGAPSVVRVNKITTTPAKPLHEVSLQIRKSLVPVQLKKSIKKASAKALKQTEVVYH